MSVNKGQESGVESQGSSVKSQESRVKSQESRGKSQESRVKGQETRVKSQLTICVCIAEQKELSLQYMGYSIQHTVKKEKYFKVFQKEKSVGNVGGKGNRIIADLRYG